MNVNDELLDKKAAFLADFGWFYGLFLYGKHHQNPLLSAGFAIALYDLIRRHDATPNQRGIILKLRGYVQKVSNPLPLPDPACSRSALLTTIVASIPPRWWTGLMVLMIQGSVLRVWATQILKRSARLRQGSGVFVGSIWSLWISG